MESLHIIKGLWNLSNIGAENSDTRRSAMDRILSTYSYGICLFSMEVLQDFLKKEKIRSKKLLHKFQKDKKAGRLSTRIFDSKY